MSSADAERDAEVRVALTQPGAGLGAGVALVALSHDGSLLDALEEVVTSDHAIHIVANEDALAECILSARCGVALIDAEVTTGSTDHLAARLRAQFPELVLIVAGDDSQQNALAGLITSGVIYRFLHKPVSAQRIRQFVDAALRRHDEEHAGAAAAGTLSSAPLNPPTRAAVNPRMLALGVATALVVVAGWYFARSPKPAPVAAQVPAARPAEPPADSALNKLLTDAEQAIVQGRTTDAATLLEQAKRVQPDNIRIAFLTGQLAKERERAVLTKARSAAANGNIGQALSALDNSDATATASTTVSETRRDLEKQQLDERVRSLLRGGTEQLQSGVITASDVSNAMLKLDAARDLAPRDAGVQRLEQAIDARIISEARTAAIRGDIAATNSWLKLAASRNLPATDVDIVRSALATAQGSARAAELARLTTNFSELLIRGRGDDAGLEAARGALNALRSYDGNGAATRDAQDRLASAYLMRGRAQLDAGKVEDAQKSLKDAQSLGAVADATAALASAITKQREQIRQQNSIVGANTLQRIRSPAPRYPPGALAQGQAGWVDVEFLVRKDGSVSEPKVVGAEPSGIFEKAALDSLAQWRFAPILRDGKPVEQHARLRVRFTID